jgi:sugar transferase (PEP-CTERM system associated)
MIGIIAILSSTGFAAMSSESLPRNEAALEATVPPLRKGDPETHIRRGADEHRPLSFRQVGSPGKNASAKPRYLRYTPSANFAQLLLDMVLIGGSQAVVFTIIRSRLDLYSLTEALVVVGLSTLMSLILLYSTGCYRRDALIERGVAISRVPTALTIAGAILFIGLHYDFPYFFPSHRVYLSISRCVTIILIGTSISLVAAILSRNVIRVLLHGDIFRRRILVIGTGQRASHIEAINRAHGYLQEMHFIRAEVLLDPEAAAGPANPLSRASLDELVDKLAVDEIVVAVDHHSRIPLDNLVPLKTRGIPVTSFNSFVERQTGRIEMAWLEVPWLIHTPGFQFRLIDDAMKRFTDIVISFAALIVCLPVLLIAMALVRLDSRGPVIYRQQRVTRGGKIFWLYKLRSMRPDAETNGAKWADKNDPRITKVGSFLRRTRLDESPQLFNILKGDMSIVGPRPERPCFVEELSSQLHLYSLRHTVRAGLTGWAQINYHYGASFEDSQRKLEYDLFYIKNFSLLRDWAIMLQTLRVILWPDGVR